MILMTNSASLEMNNHFPLPFQVLGINPFVTEEQAREIQLVVDADNQVLASLDAEIATAVAQLETLKKKRRAILPIASSHVSSTPSFPAPTFCLLSRSPPLHLLFPLPNDNLTESICPPVVPLVFSSLIIVADNGHPSLSFSFFYSLTPFLLH